MKKILLAIIIPLFFFGLSNIKASTTLQTKQVENGIIDVSITFDAGYVGGIQAVIPINGNVVLESVTWEKTLSDSYTKRYTYQNNILSIILTTGDTSKNLLDKNRTLHIGTFRLKNNTQSNQNYQFTLKSLTMIDATYKSLVLNAIQTQENNYVLETKTTDNPPSEEIPTPPIGGNEDDITIPSNPNHSGNPGTSNGNHPTNPDDLEDLDESNDDELPDENDEQEPSNPDDSKEPSFDEDDESNEEQIEKKKTNYLFIGLGVVLAFAFIIFIIYIGKSNKY